MESDRWNKWLTLAANLGVVAGLVLVASLLGATYQTRANSSMEWSKWLAESDYLIPTIEKLEKSG